jgi:nucleoid DNA-binding protein
MTTKKEIVKTIAESTALTQVQTKEVVQRTFDAIVDAIISEGRIELRNFGVFELKHRRARKARNPRTGEPVEVPEKIAVVFKPGRVMEEKVAALEFTPKGVVKLPSTGGKPNNVRRTSPTSGSPIVLP